MVWALEQLRAAASALESSSDTADSNRGPGTWRGEGLQALSPAYVHVMAAGGDHPEGEEGLLRHARPCLWPMGPIH